MALRKVLFSVTRTRFQLPVVTTRRYCFSNSQSSNTVSNQHNELDGSVDDGLRGDSYVNQGQGYKYQSSGGINNVFLSGSVSGKPNPVAVGDGVSFYLDNTQNRGQTNFNVRVRVVAFGQTIAGDVRHRLIDGQKVVVGGRLGSRLLTSPDGQASYLSCHVVARSILFV